MVTMQSYIGTKIINAHPMTRSEYNHFRGWTLPADEVGSDTGFLVEYVDGGKANHPDYKGYISWSPSDVFLTAYKPTTALDFGGALLMLKQGKRIARAGWNGKDMFLFLIQGSNDIAKLHGYGFGECVGEPVFRDAIFMKTVDNALVPWTASQSDVLASDWSVL